MEIIYQNQKIQLSEGENGFTLLKKLDIKDKNDVLVYTLDGVQCDLSTTIDKAGTVTFITKDSPEAFAILNHDAAHLLAQAVKELYPHAKFGIGPSIAEGFYYDIDFGDITLSDNDLPVIEKKMSELSKGDFRISRQIISKDEALKLFADNEYKVELIKEINDRITIYSQGNFTDLCYGPHMPSTRYVKNVKLLSLAGAYWRGDSKRKQLTRIYGVAFFTKEELDAHLHTIEEAKKRDHRKLGKELGLFLLSEYGPGFPFFLEKGMTLYHELEHWWIAKQRQNGYEFIKTPTLLSKELWEISGHWLNYRENMYTTMIDEKPFAVKPMNCPGSIIVYNSNLHSYKDLPIRLAEHGNVHRHEASGALNGLFRVRNFTQDDAHIFCRKDQIGSEIKKLLKLYDEVYKTFNLSYYIVLSTRPEDKYIGDIKTWDESEKALAKACKASGIEFKINPGDGAFYGPKLDFKLKDSIGRIWQCGTIQLDMNLPERFDMSYIDSNNQKVRPIMLHRAVFGSIERFLGILIEHYGGAFPLWLAPEQLAILPVNDEAHAKYSEMINKKLLKLGFRSKIMSASEKLGYRLRLTQINKIPYTLVIGDKERNDNLVTYRLYGDEKQVSVPVNEFIKLIKKQLVNKA